MIKTGVKKFAFKKISEELNEKEKIALTYEQIESKWRGLQRTYKKIEDNNTTGQSRKHWQYFDMIDEILFQAPEINPPATASTEEDTVTVNTPDIVGEELELNQSITEFSTNFRKRRMAQCDSREAAAEKRHRERMAVSYKFLDIFQKMVDKM